MSEEKRELLEKLKFELAFVEDGGYGRSVRTPHKPTSPFQDSLTCLILGDPSRPHPCAECIQRTDEDVTDRQNSGRSASLGKEMWVYVAYEPSDRIRRPRRRPIRISISPKVRASLQT